MEVSNNYTYMQDNQRQATLYAYLAGIMDGEGSIMISKSIAATKRQSRPYINPKYYARISLGMSDRNVLELFSKTFGHTVVVRKECVPNRKVMYRWSTSGTYTVPKILNELLPYLIVKKRQAELVIDFTKGMTDWRVKRIITCQRCQQSRKAHGRGLCQACYQYHFKHGTHTDIKDFTNHLVLPELELSRREDLYLKVKKLNAVGAAATTNQEDMREHEVIV